ncbi:MAG: hypothetical protein FJY60_02110 [Betaproteobacteria bacterium]|nr:hypothetical protein [Betaproteobacteria bacterium]
MVWVQRVAQADIAVSIDYTGVVPQPVIDLFLLGVLNVHGGDLVIPPVDRSRTVLYARTIAAIERHGRVVRQNVQARLCLRS